MSHWLALLWIPFSYVLHVALHELAHYNAARRAGVKASISLVPGFRNGRFCFAFTSVPDLGKMRRDDLCYFFLAPLVVALTWFGAFTLASLLSIGSGPIEVVLAIEAVSAGVDALWWVRGMWFGSEMADGRVWADLSNASRAATVPLIATIVIASSLVVIRLLSAW